MPLTASMAGALMKAGPRQSPCAGPSSLRSVGFLGAVANLELLVGRVLRRRRLDHRFDDLLVGVVHAGLHVPLLSVPGLDAGRGAALVVDAGSADRRHEAGEAEL